MQKGNNRNIYSVIKNHASKWPAKTLMVVENEELTYETFIRDTKGIAAALISIGVSPNQKIGMIIPNSIIWYTIFWSAVRIGAQPVPLDPQIGEWEMERLLSLGDIEICFAASKYRANHILENMLKIKKNLPLLKRVISVDDHVMDYEDIMTWEAFMKCGTGEGSEEVYDPQESDTLMLACTSGSTGNPKIIDVPHQGFYKSQQDMAGYLGFNPSDIMLLGMPLYHQGGFGMGLQMVLKGGTVFYQPTFDPEKFLQFIERHKVTVLQLTATLTKIILSVPDFDQYDLSSVRICYFAGEVLPMEVARIFFEKLNIRVVNVIGSSETATMVVWDSDYDRDVDVNIFRPLPFTKMKILDPDHHEVLDGEIGILHIHTDALIQEYYKNRDETSSKLYGSNEKKWFDTGDLGRKRPDGRIQFIGRAKRIIKRGSNLVCPEENEAFLLTHPLIEAVAVVGEKHDIIGERIVAYIQPKQGYTVTRGDLLKFCQGKLAAYKVPDRVVITDSIPHDIGKVQFKYLLQQEIGGPNDQL